MESLKDSKSLKIRRDKIKRMYNRIRLGPTTMRIKIEIFFRTYFQVENKSRKVQINILNQEKYIRKNPKIFRENSGGKFRT
jgi:hypothetical protein